MKKEIGWTELYVANILHTKNNSLHLLLFLSAFFFARANVPVRGGEASVFHRAWLNSDLFCNV